MNRSVKIKTLCDNNSNIGEEYGNSGLSLYIEVEDNQNRVRRILFDTGLSLDHLIKSSIEQDIDLSKTDYLVLSHGHFDHTGGVEIVNRSKKRVKLFTHPHTLYPKIYKKPDGTEMEVGLSKASIECLENSCDIELSTQRSDLFQGVWTTGEIPRENEFEKIEGHLSRVYKVVNNSRITDNIIEDISLIIEIGKDNLILLCGCCHSGIVNTINMVKKLSKRGFISIIGGLQLHQSSEDQLNFTTEHIRNLNLNEISPIHSSGDLGIDKIQKKLEKVYKAGGVGTTYLYRA